MTGPSDKTGQGSLDIDGQSNMFVTFGKHLLDKPLHYAGAAVFILAVVLFTLYFNTANALKARDLSSEYAEAVLKDDPLEQAAGLDRLAQDKTAYSARALYLQGEAYLTAGDHAAAEAAFIQLRETYPDFTFVPDAVEGIGFISEDTGNIEMALATYREVYETWPDTPAGRRQPMNVARCLEDMGNIDEAIASYREQLEIFPGSTAALEAQQRLTALRGTHPDHFDDPLADVAPESGELKTE